MSRPLPSPPSSTVASSDPFLAQTQHIPLSDRERQEGYDIDLVHSRPRGLKGAAGGVGPGAGVGAGSYEMRESRPSLASGGRSHSGVNGVGLGEKYPSRTVPAVGTGAVLGSGMGAAEDETIDSPTTAGTKSRRRWFLRTPAVIVLGLLLLLALALAIGLGVGLGVARRNSNNAAANSNSTSSTTTRRTGSATGTVIPSSLSSLFTTPRLSTFSTATTAAASSAVSSAAGSIARFTSPLVNPTTSAEETAEASTTVAAASAAPVTVVSSVATGRATTGNLPIPADTSTTVVDASGTHIISALSPTTTAGSKRRMKRQRR